MAIKVLHIIKGLGRGGAEMLLPATISKHSKDFKFDVVYFLPWKGQLAGILEALGCRVTCLNAGSTPAMILKIPALVRLIKSNGYDVIHCHLPWSGIVGRIAGRIAGCKVVYTEHNNFSTYHWLTRLFNKITFTMQDCVIAVSGDAANALLEHVGTAVSIRTITNGVDTEVFSRDHYDTISWKKQHGVEGLILISTVAVFRKQKRLDRWIELASKIAKHRNDIRFVIIGDGGEREMLHKQAAQLGMEGLIIFTGILEDPKPWLAASDVYLMSSDFEGLPVALLEAMSMSCVPVATRVGGIPDVLKEGINGLYYNPDDLDAAALAIAGLISDGPGIAKFSESSRNQIEKHFSLSTMVSGLEGVYRTVGSK